MQKKKKVKPTLCKKYRKLGSAQEKGPARNFMKKVNSGHFGQSWPDTGPSTNFDWKTEDMGERLLGWSDTHEGTGSRKLSQVYTFKTKCILKLGAVGRPDSWHSLLGMVAQATTRLDFMLQAPTLSTPLLLALELGKCWWKFS